MIRKLPLLLLSLFFLAGCSSIKRNTYKKIGGTLNSNFFKNQFTGLIVIDPVTKDTLYDQNSNNYFTPASNTKIFTLYTALKLLPEKIPALRYIDQNDTLYIEGTGDPSFLHPYFKDSTALYFLKKAKHIALHQNNFQMQRYGSGWAWEDYAAYYSPERNGMPLYGNVVSVFQTDSLQVTPALFEKNMVLREHKANREERTNMFFYDPTKKDTLEIPFITSPELTKELLESALGKKITSTDTMPLGEKKIVYSVPSDSVYQRMMFESDNFLAEQLLVLASATLSDTLNGKKARQHMLTEYLAGLEQPPRWVDGSGLSRYNLFSPRSMTNVLAKMYHEVPKERLFSFFPTDALDDTSKDSGEKYIYAKSGSLGNNYCLSGYLITNSGKTLIFSFMNNHFRQPSKVVKSEMEKVLEYFRASY